MRKFAVFLLIILVATVIAAIYGIGLDQVTYSISPEYYTKYEFIQFNLADPVAAQHMTQPRSAVVMVGVLATWWTGLIIGVVLGFITLLFTDADTMFRSALQALALVFLVVIVTDVIGGIYGHDVLAKKGVDWWLPEQLKDRAAYITVGSIHSCSYIGDVIGIAAGIVFLLVKNYRLRKRARQGAVKKGSFAKILVR
jgi:hypothetical protein